MATTTFKQLKNWFARHIGETDYTAVDSTGEALVNDAYKELSSRFPFECNKKLASLALSANVVTLPSDFDYAHATEVKVYSYATTTKTEYRNVGLDEVSRFSTTDFVYSLDNENDRLKSNIASSTVQMTYYAIPSDLAGNADTTKFPVPRAISALASGYHWEGVEGEEGRAPEKFKLADVLLEEAVMRNKTQRKFGLRYRTPMAQGKN